MENKIKKSLIGLDGYKFSDEKYLIKMDANEGIGFSEEMKSYRWYPDNDVIKLKTKIGKLNKMPIENILVGNGSSELIELVMKTYLDYNESVVSFCPTFTMYEIFTKIYSGKYYEMELDDKFKLDVDKFVKFINKNNAKIVLISNPNNPTGTLIDRKNLIKIISCSNAIVVVDEAYIEFADESMKDEISNYENLIVLRTFSKAFSLAGIRLGYMFAQKEIIKQINNIKSPYNVNSISQEIGIKAIDEFEKMENAVNFVKKERNRIFKVLEEYGFNPIESKTNFILFKANDDMYNILLDNGIKIRKLGNDLSGYFRVTVSTENDNSAFIKYVEEVKNERS